jgi:hypothetical protein
MPVFSSTGRVFPGWWAAIPFLALGLAACGSEMASPPAAADGVGTIQTVDPAVTGEALVSQVAIRSQDLGRRGRVRLYEGGDQVQGRVTLDHCGYDFTTESHRVARRQVAIVVNRSKRFALSNEVVAYATPERAAEALNEFRVSVETCPKHAFRPSMVQGVPDLRYEVSRLRADRSLPVEDNVVGTFVVRARNSDRRLHLIVVFQRRGTVLTGVYLSSFSRLTPAQRATLRSMVHLTGERLAAT